MSNEFENTGSLENAPSYIRATQAHAIASGDESVGGAIGAITGGLAGAATGFSFGGVPGALIGGFEGALTGYDYRLAATSAVSGVTQVANSIASIVDLVTPGELGRLDAHAVITGIDDNLGEYYSGHQEAADSFGFISASIPVGLGALKIYNKTASALDAFFNGTISRGMGKATGLLSPSREFYLQEASKAIQTTGNAFKLTDANVIKAFASGVGEQAIQGLVFEAGIQAGLNSSPLLSDQDLGDVVENLAVGTVFGGAIGGLVEGFAINQTLRNSLAIFDESAMPFQWQAGLKAGTSPADRYIFGTYEKNRLLAENPNTATHSRTLIKTISAIDDETRTILQEFPSFKGDSIGTNLLHDTLNATAKGAQDFMLAVEDIGNINKVSRLATEETHFGANFQVWGPQQGQLLTATKAYKTIWDEIPAGKQISITRDSVRTGKTTYNFDPKFTKPFNIQNEFKTARDIPRLNARDMWLEYIAFPTKGTIAISEFDFAMLRKVALAKELPKDLKINVLDKTDKKLIIQGLTPESAAKLLDTNADRLGLKLLNKAITARGELTDEGIAAGLNISKGRLTKELINETNSVDDLYAYQTAARDYAETLNKAGHKLAINPKDIIYKPQQLRVYFNNAKFDDFIKSGLPVATYIKEQQKVLDGLANNAFAKVIGPEHVDDFISSTDFNTQRTNRLGTGSSTITPADADYGTEGSLWQRVGTVLHGIKAKTSLNTRSALLPYKLDFIKSQEATTELSTIINKLTSTGAKYYIEADDELKTFRLIHETIAKGSKVPVRAGESEVIEVKNKLVRDYLTLHSRLTGERNSKFNSIRSVFQGGDSRDVAAVYFPPPDLSKYPHVAIVTDPSITSAGGAKMLYGATEDELNKLISLVPQEFKSGVVKKPAVTTGPEWEAWHKAVGDFKEAEVLGSNYFNSSLTRTGVAARAFPQTDAEVILNDLIDWHVAEETKLLREAVSLKYFKEFSELRSLGQRYEATVNTTIGNQRNQLRFFTNKVGTDKEGLSSNNPYMSYIKQALDLSDRDKIPFRAFQDAIDTKVSAVWDNFTKVFRETTSVEELEKVNAAMQKAGVQMLPYNIYDLATINHSLPKSVLESFVRKSDALIASIALKPSVLNAINNLVSLGVNTAPETKNLIAALRSTFKTNPEAYKEFSEYAQLKVGSEGGAFLSIPKLVAKGIIDAHSPAFREWSMAKGFSFKRLQEVDEIINSLAIDGTETTKALSTKAALAYSKTMNFLDKAASVTGNTYAEELTRAISANIAKGLTDIGVKHGLFSAGVADSYIQTFVNRVNGIYVASQKPMMFHGVAGQAMGLFQTYMVTFYNNLFRAFANRDYKYVAMMMAAQGTIHGAATLPGFQAFNSRLVGQFASNDGHSDVYSKLYGSVDRDTADWFMYGFLSNGLSLINPELKFNMYTRGDTNPRHISLIPISPADYPLTSISKNLFNALVDGFSGALDGNPSAILTALEHNGISREMTGLAQVLRSATNPDFKVYSTDAGGSLAGENDLVSIATLIRLAGARPLDEAILRDAVYRKQVYGAIDHANITALGKGIKDAIRDDAIDAATIDAFFKDYIKAGGNQRTWNRYWAGKYKEATVAQADRLRAKFSTLDSKLLQSLLSDSSGQGLPLEDLEYF